MRRHIKYERLSVIYRELDPAARTSVDVHVRECSSCAERLAGYEHVDQSLQALPELSLPARLQRPWIRVQADRECLGSDQRGLSGIKAAFGRALLPVSLIIVLVVGACLLFLSVPGGDLAVTATPTLTLTPTATTMAFLGDDAGPAARVISDTHFPASLSPSPGLTAARVGASMTLRIP